MKLSLISGFLIVFAATSCGAAEDTTESQHIKSDTGKELTLNIVHKQSEEDIDVIDDNGAPVIKVEIMEEHGYQIDKPANEKVCLLSQLEEFENKSLCYDRMEFPPSNTSQTILDHCEGRPVYVLVARNCSGEEIVQDVAPASSDDEGETRVKRSWRCYWTGYYSLRLVKVTRCCGRYFFFCSRRCFVRFEWRLVFIKLYRCSFSW
ncbi:uncharacterized protein LOC132739512 [Ruditapes philippinarum]|uniref:uncharacterized protein LOC132739512 n=1 Tax=Ruditapes philippinarum TaxID=129788 RepID=UPI00295B9662|nr:uncharacterized protein LOC132739512 [Ruditapes philippinarum]